MYTPSIHSWWSDSNAPGATVSLHALSKPLMKALYHRQAARFIAEHGRLPFTRESFEILSSYLNFKYISSSTRVKVLRELTARAAFEEEAAVMIDGDILSTSMTLFDSANLGVVGATCDLVVNLALHQPWGEPVTELLDLCNKLASLSSHQHASIQERSLVTLALISGWSDSATTIVANANVLHAIEVLNSTNERMIQLFIWICGNISMVQNLHSFVLELSIGPRLVSLLKSQSSIIQAGALWCLACLSRSKLGAHSLANTGALTGVEKFLESEDASIQIHAAELLSNIAEDGSLEVSELSLKSWCAKLFLLLQNKNVNVQIVGAQALKSIVSVSPQGARIVASLYVSGTLDSALNSTGWVLLKLICDIFRHTARRMSVEAKNYGPYPLRRLVSLMDHPQSEVKASALWALLCISCASASLGREIVQVNAASRAAALLDCSQPPRALLWACTLLGHFAREGWLHQQTALVPQMCAKISPLFKHTDLRVQERAVYALICLSRVYGTYTAIDARDLPCIIENMGSCDEGHLWGIVIQYSTFMAVVVDQDLLDLVSLFLHQQPEIQALFLFTIYCITGSSYVNDRGIAIINGRLLFPLAKLLSVEGKTIVDGIGSFITTHGSWNREIFGLNPSVFFASILSHSENYSHPRALFALEALASINATSQKGALAVLSALRACGSVVQLLQSANPSVLRCTGQILFNLDLDVFQSLVGGPVTRAHILPLLRHQDSHVRMQASRLLNRLVKTDPTLLKEVLPPIPATPNTSKV
ncbi:armadillo-type protein [Mycena pura]|uniref:Armadillo-type protein n=1 Tax=Mycena pura TaxID=153505 RepID=A0AAD6XZ63_9AGAR|nr:armadillo-type protein [Mycena pura]